MSSSRSLIATVDDTVIVKTASLPISPTRAFDLFCREASLAAWLCHRAVVGAGVGGLYELFWDPADPENDSTIGCRITAYEPGRVLGFQWRSPRQFKSFANAADPLTHVVVTLHATDEGTQVTLVHTGWRSSDDWRQAAAWQDRAWDFAFAALARHASQGAA